MVKWGLQLGHRADSESAVGTNVSELLTRGMVFWQLGLVAGP